MKIKLYKKLNCSEEKYNKLMYTIRYTLLIIIVAFISVNLIYKNFICAFKLDRFAYDLIGHWRMIRYMLKGIDPYTMVGTDSYIKDIGQVNAFFSESPWGLTLGIVMYGGFLSEQSAKIYMVIATIIITIITYTILYKHMRELGIIKKDMIIPIIYGIALTELSLQYCNVGVIIGCFTILSILYLDKSEVTSGILLGIAMMKPQVTLLTAFVFLLKKKYKTLCIAAGIDITAWGISSILTLTNPLTLLKEMLKHGVSDLSSYLGIFTQLYVGNPSLNLFLSMIVGIAYIYICHLILNDIIKDIRYYIPMCIVMTFWAHSWQLDRFTLIIVLLYMTKFIRSKDLTDMILSSTAIVLITLFNILMGYMELVTSGYVNFILGIICTYMIYREEKLNNAEIHKDT